MDEYSFQESIPAGFQPDLDLGIFHQQQHLLLQSPEGLNSFVLLDNQHKRIAGLVHFHIEGTLAKSPLRSPFGSYLFSSAISEKVLQEFVGFTEKKLREKGIKKLVLKNPPEMYSPEQMKVLKQVLIKVGYQVQSDEISALIPVTENSFESQLHRSEKKKLRKCRDRKLVFSQATPDRLPLLYKFLEECRHAKGYTLSMTLDELMKVATLFPQLFYLTQVTLDNTLVAANISIQVKSNVLYNFYHDHDPSFDSLSPVVFLNEGLYAICQEKGFVLLDLGTSMVNGQLNSSLLNFKFRLGAKPSSKLTFTKNLL